MFAKTHRFHGYGSLKAVYGRGKTVRGSLISLKYSTRDADKPYRVAIVVSRKVSKSAVVRNRIRRRVFEQIQQMAPAFPGGMDLVFTVYSDQVATIEAPKLAQAVQELLKKAS
jgi:ribonuclease P protein component